jgi:hypothetical protein
MSENVMSTGVMVPLSRKLTRDEYEEWSEILWDQNTTVHLNYEGTLAYTDVRGDEYGIHFGEMPTNDISAFEALEQFGINILPSKARPYTCYWYNGTDSDMGMMKLEKFLKRTNQK